MPEVFLLGAGLEKQKLLILNAERGQSSGMCAVFMNSRVFSLLCAFTPKSSLHLPTTVISSVVSNEQSGFPQTK